MGLQREGARPGSFGVPDLRGPGPGTSLQGSSRPAPALALHVSPLCSGWHR